MEWSRVGRAHAARGVLLCVVLLVAWAAPARDAHAHPLDHLHTETDIGLNKIPNHGESHILVIPVWTGEDSYPTARLEELRAYYTTEALPGTFRHYWQVVSGGRYDPIPTLVEPIVYPDSCPLPGRAVEDCDITLTDIDLLGDGGVRMALEDILARVRDGQSIDLSVFDVNGPDETPDGYFDGVVIATNIAQGVAPPLAGIANAATVNVLPGGGGGEITIANVAMVPPDEHEYGHMFGFIDLYYGPTVNCLMEDVDATLNAYSRQQIRWGEVTEITEPTEVELRPVLEGQQILRVTTETGYILIENRSGALHADFESSEPGIYVYSVDEEALPVGPFGWLDVASRDLYYPNSEPPYLNVALPVDCDPRVRGGGGCVVDDDGAARELVHASGAISPGASTPWLLRVVEVRDDGTRVVSVEPPYSSGGCACRASSSSVPVPPAGFVLGALAVAWRARRRRR